jgi:MerR family transcriptional regulator, thiopeptide resistance regulator
VDEHRQAHDDAAPHRDERRTHDWAIGELAESAGLTVRTLHHWDSIGLLAASGRSVAGHRRYSSSDVERLYRICSLRQLGLSLSDIRRALESNDANGWDLRATISTQLAEIERQLEITQRLRARLVRLLASSTTTHHPPTTDVLDVLEDMTMISNPIQRRISILVYRDIDAAFDHLISVFGLGPGEITRDRDGNAVHAEIEAGDGVVWLHPETETYGLASPATLGKATATMAVMVDDVDAHHASASAKGATVVYQPVDQPYGYREYSARDLEGGLWSFMKPLATTTT